MFGFGKKKKMQFLCPYSGTLLSIEQVDDEMFSSKAMGDGFAVEPSDGMVYAPTDGNVCACFPTGHAIGIRTEDGIEYLLHLGIDTVELQGSGFHVHVQEGDEIKQGQCLCEMDLDYIKSQQKQTTCMVVFTTGEQINIMKEHQNVVAKGKDIIEFY